MKKLFSAICIFAISSTGFAETIISCKGNTSGGSLFSSVELIKDGKVLTVKSVDYSGAKEENKVLSVDSTPVSTHYLVTVGESHKTTLVVNSDSKQAVILYEANSTSEPGRVSIEFLKCK
ncbi:MAG: hypothetical protein WA160_09930 [Pseudobdellovibrio sp.]